MQSLGGLSNLFLLERITRIAIAKWSELTIRQKTIAKKIWSIISYKWKWQIAMNIPYLAIFLLDKTVPAVHEFDMNFLTYVTSNLPIPGFISAWLELP